MLVRFQKAYEYGKNETTNFKQYTKKYADGTLEYEAVIYKDGLSFVGAPIGKTCTINNLLIFPIQFTDSPIVVASVNNGQSTIYRIERTAKSISNLILWTLSEEVVKEATISIKAFGKWK